MSALEPTADARERSSFWSYRHSPDIDYLPQGRLRAWLLALIVMGWAVEQYEGLKGGPVLVHILKDFDKTLVQWGYVGAIAGLVYACGAALWSRAADRFGRRPLMIYPIYAYAVVSALGALAPNFITLAALAASTSFLVAGMGPAVHAASRDLTPQMGRAMVYSWVSLAFTVGALMSTVIASQTLPIWPGWRPQYWIATCLALVTATILLVFFRDLSLRVRGQVMKDRSDAFNLELKARAEREGKSLDVAASYDDGRAVYRSPKLWILSFTIVFWSVTYSTVAGYVPTFLTQHYGLEPAVSAGITSYFWIVFTGSVFVSGWLSDRLQLRKPIVAFGAITTGACFWVGANLPLDTAPMTLKMVWALTGLFAGFIYPAWCALYSETAERLSPYGVARAFGITATLGPFAGLALNLGLPRVVEAFGWPTWMMIAGTCCAGVVVLVSFGHGPWMPERRDGLMT